MMIGMPELLTVGYEGRTADEVVATLAAAGVSVLVDVRLTPRSRKPGLSQRRLAERLEQAGIRYVHAPDLGNPPDDRAPLRAGDPAAIGRFRDRLRGPAGSAAVAGVAELVAVETAALLCFERDWRGCHRNLVADRLTELDPDLTVRHL
jgi:uncharacterized protein (DUF488 family)